MLIGQGLNYFGCKIYTGIVIKKSYKILGKRLTNFNFATSQHKHCMHQKHFLFFFGKNFVVNKIKHMSKTTISLLSNF